MKTHPWQLMPPMSDDEFAQLKESIRTAGRLHLPIIKDEEGNTLDGHNRERAWAELQAEGKLAKRKQPEVEYWPISDDESRTAAVFTLNLARRHLNAEQKRRLLPTLVEKMPGKSPAVYSRLVGLSVVTVRELLSGPAEAPKSDAEEPSENPLTLTDYQPETVSAESSEGADGKVYPTSMSAAEERRSRIDEHLIADPERSNKSIAEEIDCAQATVAKRRTALGLPASTAKPKAGPGRPKKADTPAAPTGVDAETGEIAEPMPPAPKPPRDHLKVFKTTTIAKLLDRAGPCVVPNIEEATAFLADLIRSLEYLQQNLKEDN